MDGGTIRHRSDRRRNVLGLIGLCSLLLVAATDALAATRQGYSLAYAWDSELPRMLEYQQRLAQALGAENQLRLVGRKRQYGVVGEVQRSLAQARQLAGRQNTTLRRLGLGTAQPICSTEWYPLYHLGLRKASKPEALEREYAMVASNLPPRDRQHLSVEKIGPKVYALVYQGWMSQNEAQRRARQLAAVLPGKTQPVLLAATVRPQIKLSTPAPQDSEDDETTLRPQQRATTSANPTIASATIKPPDAGINRKIAALLQEEAARSPACAKASAAWVAYDLTENRYLVNINLNRPFQTASMIKPFVALAFFHQVDKGRLHYSSQHRQMMEAMIHHSSNEATNWFLRQLGGPANCDQLLRREYGNIFVQVRIREYIPAGGKTYRNTALPSDYIQFLKALWHEQLPHSKEMLRVMGLPGPDRLVVGTDVPGTTMVFNKTGTTSLLCGDMGILVARGRDGRRVPYAVVGIVQRASMAKNYKEWMHASGNVIREFSSLVYEEMKRRYNLL